MPPCTVYGSRVCRVLWDFWFWSLEVYGLNNRKFKGLRRPDRFSEGFTGFHCGCFFFLGLLVGLVGSFLQPRHNGPRDWEPGPGGSSFTPRRVLIIRILLSRVVY